MATNKSPLGLAFDPETCAFCGRKVKAHSNFESASCRAALKKREQAAEAAVKEEAAKKSTLRVTPAQQHPRKKTAEEALEEYEEAVREKVLEAVLEGGEGLSEEDEKRLHHACHTQEEVDGAKDEGDGKAAEAWEYLAAFGSHGAACLHGALVGTQALHPLCTCGWNEVATELERR